MHYFAFSDFFMLIKKHGIVRIVVSKQLSYNLFSKIKVSKY